MRIARRLCTGETANLRSQFNPITFKNWKKDQYRFFMFQRLKKGYYYQTLYVRDKILNLAFYILLIIFWKFFFHL